MNRLLIGSIKLRSRKYCQILVVSSLRFIVFTPPRNAVSSGEQWYMTWRPPAAFRLLCCSLNSCIFSSLKGTYDNISRVYRSLSNSAICSYRWRLASDIVFHSTPSSRAISGNVISGFASLICDLRALTKHMYAPFGPFGRVGSTISFVLPRPVFFCALAFLPFEPSSSKAALFFVTAPFKKCSTCHG